MIDIAATSRHIETVSKGETEMMKVSELKKWLQSLPDDAVVGIDEGGLSLETEDGENWLEIGGLVEDDEDEERAA